MLKCKFAECLKVRIYGHFLKEKESIIFQNKLRGFLDYSRLEFGGNGGL